jgi:hypothetical protein
LGEPGLELRPLGGADHPRHRVDPEALAALRAERHARRVDRVLHGSGKLARRAPVQTGGRLLVGKPHP